jgi:membrane protease YdiL (CAAX protease family)
MITAAKTRNAVPVPAALAFIAGASLLRIAVAGPRVAVSLPAAALFSGVLLTVTLRTVPRAQPAWIRAAAVGIAGGVILVAAARLHAVSPPRFAAPTTSLLIWSLVVTLVACSEEFAIRGMLFDAVRSARGTAAAVATTSVVFALMHVPLYGWRVLPLDLAAGVWLGVLRCHAGVTASATAHTIADLAAGWLL